MSSFPKVPPSGVWAPAVTLFDPATDTLVPEAQAKFYAHLSKSGLAGLVILGTNAETFLLTREERKQLVQTARQAVGPAFPIMAGCGGHSTRQVLEFINDAAEAGANYTLVGLSTSIPISVQGLCCCWYWARAFHPFLGERGGRELASL